MRSLMLSVALVFAAVAGADTYEIDTAHTSALFKISHLGFSNTYGLFSDVSGTIEYDAENPEKNSVQVTVKTESINTLNEGRDKHLRTEDFLNTEKHPEMTFKSTSWKKVDDKTFEVKGDFTLLGTTKPVTTTVTLLGAGEGMKGEQRVGFETQFTIKRSEYGMDKMLPGVGDEVTITFSTEGVKK